MSDVNKLHLLYQMLLNDAEMHDNLLQAGKNLEQILKDYLLSKELQKQEIMKNINNF